MVPTCVIHQGFQKPFQAASGTCFYCINWLITFTQTSITPKPSGVAPFITTTTTTTTTATTTTTTTTTTKRSISFGSMSWWCWCATRTKVVPELTLYLQEVRFFYFFLGGIIFWNIWEEEKWIRSSLYQLTFRELNLCFATIASWLGR